MPFETIIDAQELAHHLDATDWRILDCRCVLGDPSAGQTRYRDGHIPLAQYADLERDLSGPIIRGTTGRHPLPARAAFVERVRAWGIDNNTQVVAYDDAGGAFAARLWWLLRWLGHRGVAVLDGGWNAWCSAGLRTTAEVPPTPTRTLFAATSPVTREIDCAALLDGVVANTLLLLDARDTARYRGEVEPIDPVAGHIPGARSAPFAQNLAADGAFKSRTELAERFAPLVAGSDPAAVVCYCGSGVTASHNILAMVHAGFEEPTLYPGSWSEWIVDPRRPIATG